MPQRVYIPSEQVVGTVINLMAYGARVKYSIGGLDYEVFLSDEDYVILEDEEV